MKLIIRTLTDELYQIYYNHAHYNEGDSGLDLFFPEDVTIEPRKFGQLVDLQIQCEAMTRNGMKSLSYYLYPRSSISKTPLRMSNSVGIIDAGYRGNIMVALDNHSNEPCTIQKGTRLFQICSPVLDPITLQVNPESESLSTTQRGNGGFGSTGS